MPILKDVTKRDCRILAACTEEKKIQMDGKDVVKGMKYLLRSILFHFRSIVLLGGGADGKILAAMCQEAIGSCKGKHGKRLLQSLSLSLEKML